MAAGKAVLVLVAVAAAHVAPISNTPVLLVLAKRRIAVSKCVRHHGRWHRGDQLVERGVLRREDVNP